METIRYLFTFLVLLVMANPSPAAVPSAVNYQGRFTNTAGVPQPGVKAMSLKIYDATTAGTLLYSETVGNVTVDANGVYGFQFGASGAGTPASFANALAASAEQWLELTVDGVAQAPRQKILAVPFALMAGGLPDGAVSSAMIADGAIGLSKINGLGTAATSASTDFATAAQGAKADTSLQLPGTTVAGGVLTATGASTTGWVKPFKRFRLMAAIGDSIVQNNSLWSSSVFLGTYPHGLDFKAKSAFTDTANIRIASVIAGNNTALSVVVSGRAVTINLATDGAGVSTSTNVLVRDALAASIPFQDLGITVFMYPETSGALFAAASGTTAIAARPLASSTNFLSLGFITYAQTLLNGRFDFVRRPVVTNSAMRPGDWTFGISGATSSSIRDNPGVMGDMLTQTLPVCATVLEYSGSNDVQVGGQTAAQIRDSRKATWDLIEAEGLQVIACEIAPLGPSANGITVTLAMAQARTMLADAANALCKTEAQSRGILWVEWPSTLRTSSAASNVYFTDGIHPNELGAQIMGARLATALTPYVSTPRIFMPPEGSKKWLSANPQVRDGTTTATSWSAPTGPTSGTSTPSKQMISAETWQRITVTQANSSTFNLVSMTCAATTVTAGQRIRIMGRFKVSEGFRNVSVQISYNNNGGGIGANKTYGIGGLTANQTAWEGTLLSPFDVVPFGVTSATLYVYAYGAGTVDFCQLGIVEE